MAEDLDEFGIPIKKKSQPQKSADVDDFGIPIKKKISLEAASSQSPTSSTKDDIAYEIDLPEEVNVNAKAVNPLVGNDLQSKIPQARQQELVQDVNADVQAQNELSNRLSKINQAYNGSDVKGVEKARKSAVKEAPQLVQGKDESEREGNRAGYLYNKVLEGVGNVASGLGDVVAQGVGGMAGGAGFNPVTANLAAKEYRQSVAPSVREYLKETIGANVDKGLEAKYNDETFTSAIGGLASSAPAIATTVASGGVGTGAMFLQSYDTALESINQTEAGQNLDEATKTLFAGGVGLVTSALEKYGLDKIFKGETGVISNLIAKNALKKATQETGGKVTGDLLTKFLDKEVVDLTNKYIKGGIKALDGALVEYGTEALQEGAQAGAELLTNAATGKPVFDTSETGTWDGFLRRVHKAGVAGAIGGGLLGSVAALGGIKSADLDKTTTQLNEVNTALQNEELSDSARQILVEQKVKLQGEYDKATEKIDKAYDKLSDKQKDDVNGIIEDKVKLEEAIADPNIPDSVKEGLKEQSKELDEQISDIKPVEEVKVEKQPITPKETENPLETIKTPSNETIEQPVPKVENAQEVSTPKTEETSTKVGEKSVKEKELAINEINKGVLNWDGDRFSPRVVLGLEWADIRKGREDLLAGKETLQSKRLVEAINKAKESGGYDYIQGSGKITNKTFVPFESDYAKFAELKQEDLDNILKNEKALSDEYDVWYNTLTPEEQQEEINSIDNGKENINPSGESQENVSNQKDTGVTAETSSEKINVSNNKQPAVEGETKADAEVIQRTKDDGGGNEPKAERVGTADEKVKPLDRLAHQNIESGDLNDTASNQAREKGRAFTDEERQYNVQKKMDALRHGDDIVVESKNAFGDDYVSGLLKYIDDNGKTLTADKKQLMYVTLENDLNKQLLADPDNLTLKKQEKLVADKSRAFGRETGRAVAMGQLRQLARVGYDATQVTEDFFSPKELTQRRKVEKAVQATPDDINKEYETREESRTDAEIEKAIESGVQKRIDEIYEALPSNRQQRADKAISALERIQKKLRSRTYDASIGVPVAIIDAGITTIKQAIKTGVKVADAIELGIAKIKERYGKAWKNEDKFRKDMLDGFSEEKIDVEDGSSNTKTDPTVKQALIDAGYSREMTIKNKDGVKEKRAILNWKLLVGSEGSLDNINTVVDKVLPKKGYSEAEIENIKQSLKDEYNDLHASIIEKAQNELENRNKERPIADVKSSARRLAELYNYGLFEKNEAEFDRLINSAVGLSDLGQQAFAQSKKLAQSLAILYSQRDTEGRLMPEITFKKAVSDINSEIESLLTKVANNESNWKYKTADVVGEYMGLSQRNALVSGTQLVENTLSGYIERAFMDLGYKLSNNVQTKELRLKNKELSKAQFYDIVLNAGNDFGSIGSPFLVKSKAMDKILKWSDSQYYHATTSALMGRAFLEGADSMHKINLTEKFFTYNLVKVLRKKGMGKQEAINFVSERLTGQSWQDAKVQAKDLIEKINTDAGEKVLSTESESVTLLANDIVKNALLLNNTLSVKEVESSYKAAYKAAGLGLGHEANNMLSEQIAKSNQNIQSELKQAIKDKDWGEAVNLRLKSILMNNVMNPFVGGGTNWMFLTAEKAGINPLAWYRGLRSTREIDLTTDSGIKRLEKDLYASLKRRNSAIRTLTGIGIALSVFAASKSTDEDDAFAKWLKKNQWAQKYFDKIAPTSAMFLIAEENKDLKKFFAGTLNVKDRDYFADGAKVAKIVPYIWNQKEVQKKKSLSAAGDLIGGKVGTPIIPWRLIRDEQNIKRGLNGLEPLKPDYKTKGFWHGFFKGGSVEYLKQNIDIWNGKEK